MAPLPPEHLETLLGLAQTGDTLTRDRCIVAAAKIDPDATAKRFAGILRENLQGTLHERIRAAMALDAIGPVNAPFRTLIEQARQDPRIAPYIHGKSHR